MASASVQTPLRSHRTIFSTKTAGGRMPLTPSPRKISANISFDPITPARYGDDEPLFVNNFAAKLQRSAARTAVRFSPKSNIAKINQSPRRLDAATSEFTLIGTGALAKQRPSQFHKDAPVRARPSKNTVRVNYNAVDRFIPTRSACEGISTNVSKLDVEPRPRSSRLEGSAVLSSNAASALDFAGLMSSAADDLALAMDQLDMEERVGEEKEEEDTSNTKLTPRTAATYQATMAAACGVDLNTRILAFKPNAPESKRPHDLRAQYNRPLKSAANSANNRRKIPSAPDRVLDAPGLVDDYYLNLLDWSIGDDVAIAMDHTVYVWSAESGAVTELVETKGEGSQVASVKWSNDGHFLSLGLTSGEVQLWDVEAKAKLRSLFAHDSRVSALSWSKHTLSTGARSGLIINHDVRVSQHKSANLVSHDGEICGLEWRADGGQLASGGNDNLVSIWDARYLEAPRYTKNNHTAAVKALSWCPWQPNLLATGGGSHDKHIHFWNATTGARVNSIDTGSQVTSLKWSPHYKEIASTGGFPDNSVSVWSYPTLIRNIEIPAHDSRILHSALSPDGQVLATAAADESLKFWRIFERKPGSSVSASSSHTLDALSTPKCGSMTIR